MSEITLLQRLEDGSVYGIKANAAYYVVSYNQQDSSVILTIFDDGQIKSRWFDLNDGLFFRYCDMNGIDLNLLTELL